MESNHPKPERGMGHIKPFDLGNKPMMHPDFPPKRGEMHKSIWFFDISTAFLFLMIVAITMATQINLRLDFSQKQALKAEADKAEAELSFLKAQINPHFLFNTLNNIYTLALSSNPNTAESIMKLSNIMRYVTDEVESDWVDLEDELNCINNYIALQKLRLGDKTPVDVNVSGNLKNVKIAPLLLMTFVENAFKYGVSKQKESPILIRVNVNDREIHFRIQNNIFSNNNILTRKGIGIANTKRRLEHIYPNKHYLEIVNQADKYLVDLVLDIV